MSRALRWANLLPRSWARSMRNGWLAVLDLRDRLFGRNEDLIPPRSLHFVGSGDFGEIGRRFLGHFIHLCGLRPDETVLDIGCGTGRMAVPLLEVLDERGAYVGFDVSHRAIRWCREQITSRNERFTFVVADVWNREYNPSGTTRAEEYRFPCESSAVDFVFATSVFTHMSEGEIRRYLSELARVLRPSGRALLTFFLVDAANRDLILQEKAAIPFEPDPRGGRWTIDRRVPERAIAYDESVFLDMLSETGLILERPILWGSWSGRADALDFQDIAIVKGAAIRPSAEGQSELR